MIEVQIANQKQTLKNAIDNVNAGRYTFKSGVGYFRRWCVEVETAVEWGQCAALLDEADKEMTKPMGKTKAIKPEKRRKFLGIF